MQTDRDANIERPTYVEIMLEQMTTGVALYDAHDFRLLEANAAYFTILDAFLEANWRHGRTLNHLITEWGWKKEVEGLLGIFEKVAATGIIHQTRERHYLAPDGVQSYWDWSLKPIVDEAGSVTHLLETANDVTAHVLARQQAQQVHAALTQSKQFIEAERHRLQVVTRMARSLRRSLNVEEVGQTAIDAIQTNFGPQSIFLHIVDPGQHTLSLIRAHGPPTSAKQRRALEQIPFTSAQIIAEAYRSGAAIIIEDVGDTDTVPGMSQRTQMPLVGEETHGIVCVPLRLGNTSEGTLTATFRERIHADGQEVQAILESGTFIAAALAQSRLHAAVEEERRRLRAILDQIPEGILIVESTTSSISYANDVAAQLLGIPLSDLISAPVLEYAQIHAGHGRDLDGHPFLPWHFALIRALTGETIKSRETLITRPDSSTVITLTSSAPLQNENGGISGAAIVFQDITAQKSLEQQQNEFLWMANHELRTPITIIQGFAELLELQSTQEGQDDEHADSEVVEHAGTQLSGASLTRYALHSIMQQSEQLTGLIEEMLDLTRIEHEQFVLNYDNHDVLQVLTRVLEHHRVTTTQHQLSLVVEGLTQEDSLFGYFDEAHIIQALNNLLNNAIKYSPQGGAIQVGLRYAASRPLEALMWVKDQGIGIGANEIPHIFRRFHRSANLDPSLSGLGIGLYLVKEVITHHGGRVWVDSSPGAGSTFFLLLPLGKNTTEEERTQL